ncbi:WXG100 family type VII secretion target [Streptomyces mirabilis]
MDFSDGYIYVDYKGTESSVSDMQEQSQAIAAIIEQMEMDLAQLKDSWIGDDKDVYADVQAKWDGAVENIRRLLHNHGELLTDISSGYRQSEQSRSQRWGEIQIGSR